MDLMTQAGRASGNVESECWMPAESFVPLEKDEVQVWRVRAIGEGPFYEACVALLSPDELERWRRLRAGMARDEFVIARGCLRMLLRTALGQMRREDALRTGKHGKPFVDGIEFNVTHSRGLILLALSRNTEIGIDVEWIDPKIETIEIAEETFTPAEFAHIASADEGDDRLRAFYRCWVRKEALTKAHGQGITLPLQSFEVDLASEGETCVTVKMESGGPQYFYLQSLPAGGNYASALALTKPSCRVRLFELLPEMIIGH